MEQKFKDLMDKFIDEIENNGGDLIELVEIGSALYMVSVKNLLEQNPKGDYIKDIMKTLFKKVVFISNIESVVGKLRYKVMK